MGSVRVNHVVKCGQSEEEREKTCFVRRTVKKHHNPCIKSTQRSFVLTKGALLWVLKFMPLYFGYK